MINLDVSACGVDGCGQPRRARGWCNKHYRRWKTHGDPLASHWERGDTSENFWRKVQRGREDECWLFTGSIKPDGYGNFVSLVGSLAHRFSYALVYGPIPAGMDVDHQCHGQSDCTAVLAECLHRRCVNPSHLRIVSQAEHKSLNKPGRRGECAKAAKRSRTHCRHGHEYTASNTYVNPRGARECRTCQRARGRLARRADGGRERHRTYQRERMRRVRAQAELARIS